MARRKIENKWLLPPIILDMDDPDQKAVVDNYRRMTRGGHAAEWVRTALIASLGSKTYAEPVAEIQKHMPNDDELRYEEISDV